LEEDKLTGQVVTVHCSEGGVWRVMDSQRLLLYGETLVIH